EVPLCSEGSDFDPPHDDNRAAATVNPMAAVLLTRFIIVFPSRDRGTHFGPRGASLAPRPENVHRKITTRRTTPASDASVCGEHHVRKLRRPPNITQGKLLGNFSR